MNHYPDIKEVLENPDHNRLLVVRRALFSQLRLIVLFIILLSAVITAWSYGLPNSIYLLVIPILLALEIIRRQHNDVYIFSISRLTHLRGRLSLAYNVPVVRYVDIRAINVLQDFWGRLFNYGDLAIGTAAQMGNEIVIIGVNSPEELALLLDQLKTHEMSGTK